MNFMIAGTSGRLGSSLRRMISVPAGKPAKSMITSRRSAGAMGVSVLLPRSIGAPMTTLILRGRGMVLPFGSARNEQMIWVGTILGVMGTREVVGRFALDNECRVQPRLRTFGALFNPSRAGISEVVIPPGSRLVGQTIAQARLRTRFGISVLAINRRGEALTEDIRDIELETGDCLVSHSTWRDLAAVSQDRDFVVATDIPSEEQRPHKVGWAAAFFGVALCMVLFTDIRLSVALLTGAMGMILTGVLNIEEAYEAVSWKTVFLLDRKSVV